MGTVRSETAISVPCSPSALVTSSLMKWLLRHLLRVWIKSVQLISLSHKYEGSQKTLMGDKKAWLSDFVFGHFFSLTQSPTSLSLQLSLILFYPSYWPCVH